MVTTWGAVPEASNRLQHLQKTIELDGTAGNGQFASPTITIFTITGTIQVVSLAPRCTENLVSAGGGTLELGVVGDTDGFIGATTATDIDAGDPWFDTSPAEVGLMALPAALKDVSIPNGADIVGTVGTADITDGTLVFDLLYIAYPGGSVS